MLYRQGCLRKGASLKYSALSTAVPSISTQTSEHKDSLLEKVLAAVQLEWRPGLVLTIYSPSCLCCAAPMTHGKLAAADAW